MKLRLVDLSVNRADLVDQAARLLHDAFVGRTADWQDLESAHVEVLDSLTDGKVSRVALNDESGHVVGWIGAAPAYGGHVWEIHPLVVAEAFRRHGVGRMLIEDLESLARTRGATTLWAASDDEHGETSLSGVDLYPDIPAAIRNVRNLKSHPYEFYVRAGFTIAGILPDANGPGKPDIFLAKRIVPATHEGFMTRRT